MKKIIIILSVLFSVSSFSQPAEYFLGQNQLDVTQEIVEAPDGNLFLIGSTTEYRTRIWLQKMRPDGSLIWDKIFFPDDRESNEHGFGLKIEDDGNLLIFGQRTYNGLGNEYGALIIKTDSVGNEIWKRIIPEATAFFDLVKTGTGYLVTGHFDSSATRSDAVIISLDSEGRFLGKTVHNISAIEYGKKILPTPFPGQFLVIGKAFSGDAEFNGFYMQMIREDRSLVWAKRIDMEVREEFYLRTFPAGYHKSLGAFADSDSTFWVAAPEKQELFIDLYHFSMEGDFIEKKSFGSHQFYEFPTSLIPLKDGGFLITGITARSWKELSFVIKIDKNKSEVWRKYYGKEGFQNRLLSGIETKSGQIFLAGMSNQKGTEGSDFDAWFLIPESNGNTLPISVKGKIVLDLNNNCLADPGEPGLPHWFVNIDLYDDGPILSDKNGNFEFHTEPDSFSIYELINPYPEIYEICKNPLGAFHFLSNPNLEVTFLVKNKNLDCLRPTIEITEPNLVRCDTSQFTITVFNQVSKSVAKSQLLVELDNDLFIKKASLPFEKNGTVLKFELDSIPILKSINIDLSVETACDIQIGAVHPITAWIEPDFCKDLTDSPNFTLTGKCIDNETVFEFKNTGSDASVNPIYEISGNEILLEKDLEINLKNAGSSELLQLPADGRTWRIDLKPTPDLPLSKTVSASLEGCGLQKNGLYATGYSNVRRRAKKLGIAAIFPTNSVGQDQAVLNGLTGVGGNIGDRAPFDFTAQMKNPLSENAHTVEFRFQFNDSGNSDPASFRLLAHPGEATVQVVGDELISVILKNLDLESGKAVGIRFSFAPLFETNNINYTPVQIFCKAYFNYLAPYELERGSYAYIPNLNRNEEAPVEFPEDILTFGNWITQSSSDMAVASDGSAFLAGNTYDFGGRNHKAKLVKVSAEGTTDFLEAYKIGKVPSRSYIEKVLPSENGGCLILGNYIHTSSPYRIYIFLAETDAKGKLIWSKGIDTLGIGEGATLSSMAALPDGNILFTGRTGGSSNNGYFYAKADRKGNLLKVKLYPPTGDFFTPEYSQITADGSIVSIYTEFSKRNFFIQKVDSSFNQIFYRTIIGSGISYSLRGFTQSPDGGFMASTSWEKSFRQDGSKEILPTIIKFSKNGIREFQKVLELPDGVSINLSKIIPAPDGGYFCGGSSSGFLLLKIDEMGEFLWLKNWKSEVVGNFLTSLALLENNKIALFGRSNDQGNSLGLDQWVFWKTDLQGNLIGTSDTKTIPEPSKPLVIFPNPAAQKTTVILSPAPTESIAWHLFDLSGKRLLQGTTQTGGFSIKTSHLPNGMYILHFLNSDFPTRKILVEK